MAGAWGTGTSMGIVEQRVLADPNLGPRVSFLPVLLGMNVNETLILELRFSYFCMSGADANSGDMAGN